MKNVFSQFTQFTSILLIGVLIVFNSCNSDIQPDSLDKWVRANDFRTIKNHIYKKNRVGDKKFKKLIQLYSDSINAKQLIARPLVDRSFKKLITGRDRKGYEYVDEMDNLHFSITYKLVTLPEDSSVQFNFIDFRATDGKLPSLKVPGFGPIRAIYTDDGYEEMKALPAFVDSLEAIGPMELYGRSYYHVRVLEKMNRSIPKDSIKSAIVFNINNNWVKGHMDLIIKGLEERIDLSNYDLAYMETVSTPTLRLGFDAGFNPYDLPKMFELFEGLTHKKMIISPSFAKKFKAFSGNFYIGHSVVEKRKIGGF